MKITIKGQFNFISQKGYGFLKNDISDTPTTTLVIWKSTRGLKISEKYIIY